MNALIEGGFLQLVEKSWRGKDEARNAYRALALTQKGRDALAGGVDLSQTTTTEGEKA